MDDLCRFSKRPVLFIGHYVRERLWSHVAILLLVLGAVACSVTTQYGVKYLVDTLSTAARESSAIWFAFLLLTSLIAADNLLWRLAGWIASYSFVAVTGDLRRDLFRHLTGHAATYFADQLPGTLTSRITATSNAVFTIENMLVWNVLPPCAACIGAIGLAATVSLTMAAALSVFALLMILTMFYVAAAGAPLHHDFASKAAAVDGEMVDIIGNMPMVRAFCGIGLEHSRFKAAVDRETGARRRSLRYLEKLRLVHAVVTIIVTLGVLAWALTLWQHGAATAGQVVLICTLTLSVLHATRDLAVALVDVTQHMARLSEALATLLVPHQLRDHPEAAPLMRRGASVSFDGVCFSYPDGRKVFDNFSVSFGAGQRVGVVGASGAGKSTLIALIQRVHDVQSGRILIDGQNISHVTQASLSGAISIVPQDTSLFHRSLMENIRYGRPNASDEEVIQAAIDANCHDFIAALPQGYATTVGDRGVKISGGQRQRIAIARAFLKDAPILLLDEATSALDTKSEDEIRQALGRLVRGRTVIAIAHRVSTLRSFDRIILLQSGQILQDGAPDVLMRQAGPYRQLVMQEMSRLQPKSAA